MIRSWLRRRGAGAGDGRGVDTAVFLGAQFDLRDGQIAGLRDALAEANTRAERAERRAAVLEGQLSTYKAREFMATAARLRARLAEEPTAQVSADQFRRTRPSGSAPATEQYRRPR